MKREEVTCRIVREKTKVNLIDVKKGLLNSTMIYFDKEIPRGERENIEKCFKKNKINVVWGKKCLIAK